jgi:parvulin-like peptidyl-prolyl isomerase
VFRVFFVPFVSFVFQEGKMTSMTRVIASVAVALALVAGVRADIIEQILIKVNGEVFTKTQLEARQVSALRGLGRNFDPATDPTGAELRKALEEITPRLVVSIVDELLIEQRGRELGYSLGDEQFKTILDGIKKDNNITTDEQMQAALDQERLTLAELRRNIERSMIIQRVQQNEVISRVAVSEDEARRYYENNTDEFTKPAQVTLREIFIAVPGDGVTINVAADEAARARAEDIRRRALAGESFAALATEASDSPSKTSGGLVGPLRLDELVPELRTRLQAMKPGEVGELARTPRGYQLLQLDTLVPPEVEPFERAREEISARVLTGRRQEELFQLIQRLRSQAIIEWKNEELRRAYDLGLKQTAPASAAR